MNNEQNIFYTSISKYYSEIFPYRPMQLNFVFWKYSGTSAIETTNPANVERSLCCIKTGRKFFNAGLVLIDIRHFSEISRYRTIASCGLELKSGSTANLHKY